MPLTFTLPPEYGAVVAVGLSTYFLGAYHTALDLKWRRKAGIKPPHFHVDAEQLKENKGALQFTCAQRAHANMLETLPFFLTSLAWAGIRYPLIASGAGVTWIISRVIYVRGYISGSNKRGRSFVASMTILTLLHGLAFYSSWEMYNGRW